MVLQCLASWVFVFKPALLITQRVMYLRCIIFCGISTSFGRSYMAFWNQNWESNFVKDNYYGKNMFRSKCDFPNHECHLQTSDSHICFLFVYSFPDVSIVKNGRKIDWLQEPASIYLSWSWLEASFISGKKTWLKETYKVACNHWHMFI